MKKLFYMLIFAFFATFSRHASADLKSDAACLKVAKTPKVMISLIFNPLEYDMTKNNRTLTRLHAQINPGTKPSSDLNGLSTYDLKTDLNFHLESKPLFFNSFCTYPTEINLTFEYTNPFIYISRNLKEGSCTYNLTLYHEQTHQQINREVLEYYMPEIRQAFLTAVKDHPMVTSTSETEDRTAYFTEVYRQAINPILEKITAEIKAEQAKLDSKENYRYEHSVCFGKD